MAIRLILIFLFSFQVQAWDQFGYTGSLLSPLTQAERDGLLMPLPAGVMVYNINSNEYQYWDGTAWRPMGGGGGGTPTVGVAEASRHNTLQARPTTNTASFFMLNEPENVVTVCGNVINDAANGVFFQASSGCLVAGTFNVSQGGTTKIIGFSLNPSAIELAADFANLPVTKVLCKDEIDGHLDNVDGCSFSYAARAGDRIYLHGPVGGTFGAVDLFNVTFAATVGGSGASGNVSGLPPTTVDNLAAWDDTGGTLIKDSGIPFTDLYVRGVDNLVSGPFITDIFAIPGWGDTTGTQLSNSQFYFIATDATQIREHVVGFSGDPIPGMFSFRSTDASGATMSFISRDYSNSYTVAMPRDPPVVGDILVTDGIGQLRWEANAGGGGGGNVTGPGATRLNHVALWNSLTGSVLKETNYEFPVVDGAANQILKTDGLGLVTWQVDAGGTTLPTDNAEAGKVILSDGTDNPAWLAYPLVDSILVTTPLGVTSWETKVGYGDVSGPAVSVIDRIATYANTSGKVIKDSGFLITDLGDVKGPAINTLNAIPWYSGTTGKLIQDSTLTWNAITMTIPGATNMTTLELQGVSGKTILSGAATTADYTLTYPSIGPALANQYLVSDALGNYAWTTAPTGPVNGPVPAVSTDNAIAQWDGVSGRLLKQTLYTVPNADGTAGQVLITDGLGVATWNNPPGITAAKTATALVNNDQIALEDNISTHYVRVGSAAGSVNLNQLPFTVIDVDLSGNTRLPDLTRVILSGTSDTLIVTVQDVDLNQGAMINGDITLRRGDTITLIYDAPADRFFEIARNK